MLSGTLALPPLGAAPGKPGEEYACLQQRGPELT